MVVLVFSYLDPKMLINLILDPMNVFFCAILLLINVTSGRIFISKDVLFNESRFHYSTLFTTPPLWSLNPKMFPYHPFPSTTLLPIHANTSQSLPTSTSPSSQPSHNSPTILSPQSVLPSSVDISQPSASSQLPLCHLLLLIPLMFFLLTIILCKLGLCLV